MKHKRFVSAPLSNTVISQKLRRKVNPLRLNFFEVLDEVLSRDAANGLLRVAEAAQRVQNLRKVLRSGAVRGRALDAVKVRAEALSLIHI